MADNAKKYTLNPDLYTVNEHIHTVKGGKDLHFRHDEATEVPADQVEAVLGFKVNQYGKDYQAVVEAKPDKGE